MGQTHYRYMATWRQHQRELVQTWLASHPAGHNCDYTYGELEYELFAAGEEAGHPSCTPRPAGIRPLLEHHGDLIHAAGFEVTFWRTNSARYISIRPRTPA